MRQGTQYGEEFTPLIKSRQYLNARFGCLYLSELDLIRLNDIRYDKSWSGKSGRSAPAERYTSPVRTTAVKTEFLQHNRFAPLAAGRALDYLGPWTTVPGSQAPGCSSRTFVAFEE